jgi:hypothetical protein
MISLLNIALTFTLVGADTDWTHSKLASSNMMAVQTLKDQRKTVVDSPQHGLLP